VPPTRLDTKQQRQQHKACSRHTRSLGLSQPQKASTRCSFPLLIFGPKLVLGSPYNNHNHIYLLIVFLLQSHCNLVFEISPPLPPSQPPGAGRIVANCLGSRRRLRVVDLQHSVPVLLTHECKGSDVRWRGPPHICVSRKNGKRAR